MNIDLVNLVGKFAKYRPGIGPDETATVKVTIQGCCWPAGHQVPQLIATTEDGAFVVDTIKRFRVL